MVSRIARTPSDSNANVQRGDYQHTGLSSFEVRLSNGIVVTSGTGTALVNIEDIGSFDTFRYREGDCFVITCGDPILVNGVQDTTALLAIAIGEMDAFGNDSLPDPFPFAGTESHTFSLGNDTGTDSILLQFQALRSGACPSDLLFADQILSGTQILLATSTGTLGPNLTINADNILVEAPTVAIFENTEINGSFSVGTNPSCP